MVYRYCVFMGLSCSRRWWSGALPCRWWLVWDVAVLGPACVGSAVQLDTVRSQPLQGALLETALLVPEGHVGLGRCCPSVAHERVQFGL